MHLLHQPLAWWRRARRVRALRRHGGHVLPGWALAELMLPAAQAAWLLRSLCRWHAVPSADTAAGTGPLSMPQLAERLAARGVLLQACRAGTVQALQRGDMLVLADGAVAQLSGQAGTDEGDLVLVLGVSAHELSLALPARSQALRCAPAQLQAVLAGWVLRSQLQPGHAPTGSELDSEWAPA